MTPLAPATLRSLLLDGGEIALLDVREAGAFQAGHLLLSVNLPLAEVAARIGRLVPRRATRIVLVDEGAGLAEQAAESLRARGYHDLACLAGGAPAWGAAGYELFPGTYTINNVFALHVERTCGTPRIGAEDLAARQASGAPPLVLDSRPLQEYRDGTIPGAVEVPLAELIERVPDLLGDPAREIVVTCGGRARAVLGAQSLINAGLENPVSALYYGTTGWDLAGYDLARGSSAVAAPPSPAAKAKAQAGAAEIAERFGVQAIGLDGLDAWLAAREMRTLYLIDVRSAEEFHGGHLPESRWVPGGELVGLTEDHMATRGARVCLLDDSGARASLTASWLIQMGWPEVAVLTGGVSAWQDAGRPLATSAPPAEPPWSPPAEGDRAQRHAAARQTMEQREAMLAQLARDGTLGFPSSATDESSR
ncbi:MAG: rhodanese-like domain-containing protein [Pseudomonadota bacterium]